MRRPPLAAAFLFLVASAYFRVEAETLESDRTTIAAAATPNPSALINENNLLLVEVILDQLSITDSLPAYDSPDGLLIPIGELSRLLDVDLTIFPADRRITGSIGQARKPLLVDIPTGTLRIAGNAGPLTPDDIVVGSDEIFVRAALLEKIIPVRVNFDSAALRLTLQALEPLPIQARLDRLGKLRDLQPDAGSNHNDDVYRLVTPYKLLDLPSLDVSLEAGAQRRTPKTPYRYDVRAGGDLLYGNFQGFLGSDDHGKPVSARALIERRDAGGRALGGLGLTRFSAGDVYTPSLAIGPRSLGGRGFSISSAPLTQQAVFGKIDLRGELPLGYDVELYVNDVLRSGQSTPVQGRYEFRDVPLVRGVNVIRIISYGPRGERSEEVRVVSVGGGQVEKGELAVDLGVTQQERSLIDLRSNDSTTIAGPGVGDLRVAINILYGLTEMVTLNGGAAVYSPSGAGERRIGTAGLRTSLLGVAVQVDAAADDRGGTGAAVALAGRLFGISTIFRHGEYRGGFIDETIPSGGDGRALLRSSEIDLDWALKAWGKHTLPLSLRLSRDQFANGDLATAAILRASSALGGVYLSAGLDYARTEIATGASDERLTGVLSASSFAAFEWQLRGSVDYNILPRAQIRAVSLVGDRNLSETFALRVGVGRSFLDEKETTFQVGATSRLKFADLSLNAEYGAPRHDWRIGFQMAFSLARDPLGGAYAMARPGAAAGGNLALQAFVDRNGDGKFEKGEPPVPGVGIDGGPNRVVTDDQGRALVTGLNYGSVAQVRTSLDDVALDDVAAPASVIEFAPRAGTTTVAMFPIQPKGSIMLHVMLRRSGGRLIGLSAAQVRAVDTNGKVVEGTTEFDGSILFDTLRAGTYRFELDPVQAKRLNMRLEAPITFHVDTDGGVLPDVQAVVVFDNQ